MFAYYVTDPQRFGVVDFDEQDRAVSIEEKPEAPRTNWAVTGLYMYDADVVEIARNIQEAATGTQDVSSHIVGVSTAADESGRTAEDVLSSTERLTAESEALGGEVDRFLQQIRAA